MTNAASIPYVGARPVEPPVRSAVRERLDRKPGVLGLTLLATAVVAGITYTGFALVGDLKPYETVSASVIAGLAVPVLIALGFEFVNGFHDTANAVATVIYTRSLEPNLAVIWSGLWNFIGVLTSTGGVAFGIISLLPVELILQSGRSSGFVMIFSLLAAAIIWNVGTWFLGLPSSSSHALIGSIIGVGLANQAMQPRAATSGVDWTQAEKVGKSLLVSPLVGFAIAALVLLLARRLIRNEKLYKTPEGDAPPPLWIRGLLVLTCTGVSYAHGSNDGQKGMGLIMLILVGTAPFAYALNRHAPLKETQAFIQTSSKADDALGRYLDAGAKTDDAYAVVTAMVRTRSVERANLPALRTMVLGISEELKKYGDLKSIPDEAVGSLRNRMYLVSEAMGIVLKASPLKVSKSDAGVFKDYKKQVDKATKFIPTWVKICTAIALGLGTMIGWKRIVITVGEKIGKDHLTYGQGAAAELTAMTTILLADAYGLPVSTTHVLSSGVAGSMVATGSKLQWSTVRNLLMAWVLTLPASIGISGMLFWALSHVSS